jgi:hypothetical protein
MSQRINSANPIYSNVKGTKWMGISNQSRPKSLFKSIIPQLMVLDKDVHIYNDFLNRNKSIPKNKPYKRN